MAYWAEARVRRRAEVSELPDDLGDIVPLPPAELAVLLPFPAGIAGLAPEPLRQPVEQRGHMVDEFGVSQFLGFRHVADVGHRRTPHGQNGVGLPVEVLRQQGGFAHDRCLFATTALPARFPGGLVGVDGPWPLEMPTGSSSLFTSRRRGKISIDHHLNGCQAHSPRFGTVAPAGGATRSYRPAIIGREPVAARVAIPDVWER